MNLDFSAEPVFSWYVVALGLSGVIMLALAVINAGQKPIERLLGAVFGVGFIGYAVYLGFMFEGREYTVFFYAFILPVMMVVKFVQALMAGGQDAAEPAPAESYAAPLPLDGAVPQMPDAVAGDSQNTSGHSG